MFRISYAETARIAEMMAEMVRAGLPMERIFRVMLRQRRTKRARRGLEALRDAVMGGRKFHEGLLDKEKLWPRYFIELVRCTERAGMLSAGFAEGAVHFRKLAAAWKAANMLWMGPAVIVIFGWFIRGLVRLHYADLTTGLVFWGQCLQFVVSIATVAVFCLFIPPVRRIVDACVLHLPIIGETVRDLAIYQFTACFRYLYIGAVRAAEMVRMAGEAVGNREVSGKLKRAALLVEQGAKFTEALEREEHWPQGYIEGLQAAEVSGSLDTVLDKLAEQTRATMEYRVERVRKAFEPLLSYAVAVTIAVELYLYGTDRNPPLAHWSELAGLPYAVATLLVVTGVAIFWPRKRQRTPSEQLTF